MLSRISIAGKWALLYISLSLPFVLVGQVFGGTTGAAIGFLLGGLVFFALCMLAEQVVFNAHRALGDPPPGLARTYQHVVDAASIRGRVPGIYVFPDPSPLALVARNPVSEGMILLSQGVVSSLNERDLRVLLEGCLARVSSARVPLSTVAGVVALGFVRFVPSEWLDVFLQSEAGERRMTSISADARSRLPVASALRLVAFLPLIRYFLFLGGGERVSGGQILGFATLRVARHWFRIRHRALFHLYLTG